MGMMMGTAPMPPQFEGTRYEGFYDQSDDEADLDAVLDYDAVTEGAGDTLVTPTPVEQPPTDPQQQANRAGAEAAYNAQQAAQSAPSVAPAPVAPPQDHAYGASGGMTGSGYVSSSEMLIWLQNYSTSMSELQRDLMMGCDLRNKLVEDLAFLKAQIREGGSREGDVDAYVDGIEAHAQQMLEAYEGTPYYETLVETLGPITGNGDKYYSADEVTNITGNLQGLIDSLGKSDQMDMIQIQDIMSQVSNKFQAVSKVMASTNDTVMAIISSIGR
jgi:hypothetical protein